MELERRGRARRCRGGRAPSLSTWKDDVYQVLTWLMQQTPMLCIRALIGHGAAADACHAFACEYGAAASCPVRLLVALNGSHELSAKKAEWPVGGWKMLSIVGDGDSKSSVIAAQSFHDRHESKGHKLRILAGANRALDDHIQAATTSINDWVEGARRLTGDDVGQWDASRGRPVAPPPVKPDGVPVGSMAAVRDIQAECFAEDVLVSDYMAKWSEERLRRYFEDGGGVEV